MFIQENKKWIPEADYPKIEAKWKLALSELTSTPELEKGEGAGRFFKIFVNNIATWKISIVENAILFRNLFPAIIQTRGLHYLLDEIMRLAIPFADIMQSGIDLRSTGLDWAIARLSMIVENAIERSSFEKINETLAQPQSNRLLLSPHLFLKAYLNGVSRSTNIGYEHKYLLAKKYLSQEFPGEIQKAALDLAVHAAWKIAQESKKARADSSPVKEVADTVDFLINYFFELGDSTENIWLRIGIIKGISSIPSPTEMTKDFFLSVAINQEKYSTELRQMAYGALLKARGYLDPGVAYGGGRPDHFWLRNLHTIVALKFDLFKAKVARSCGAFLR